MNVTVTGGRCCCLGAAAGTSAALDCADDAPGAPGAGIDPDVHGSKAPAGFGNDTRMVFPVRSTRYSTGCVRSITTRTVPGPNGAMRSIWTPPRSTRRWSRLTGPIPERSSTTLEGSARRKSLADTSPSTSMTTSVRSATGTTLNPVTAAAGGSTASESAMSAIIPYAPSLSSSGLRSRISCRRLP